MPKIFTTSERQRIVNEHIATFGDFKLPDFLEAAKDPDHPAHGYFDWNDDTAAHLYRIQQARVFVATIKIALPEVTDHGKIRAFVSPMETRRKNESIYVSIQTPEGMLERMQQAISDVNGLERWVRIFGPIAPDKAVKFVEQAIREFEKAITAKKAA